MVTYNIPTTLVESYRGRHVRLVVRAESASELVACLTDDDLDRLAYLQLMRLTSHVDTLRRWDSPIPLDLVVPNPEAEFPKLYEYADLVASRPIRVSLRLTPGFSKAVKLATSLNLAVKLVVTQFDQSMLDEILQVLDLYLHRSTVCEPVEFFHSLLDVFYRGDPATIWAIQEEDPAEFRYITDQGEEVLSARIPESIWEGSPDTFLDELARRLRSGDGECSGCEFLDVCRGYFKWPRREYRCEGVKELLRAVRQGAEELRKDVAACRRMGSENK